jgi:hypothetical protein
MTKIGLAREAYRGAPHGCGGQWSDAPELRHAQADWSFSGRASRALCTDKRCKAAVMFALAALGRSVGGSVDIKSDASGHMS